MLSDLFSNLPNIIRESAKSRLGIIALALIILGIISYLFFRQADDLYRILALIILIIGFLLFISTLFMSFSLEHTTPENYPSDAKATERSVSYNHGNSGLEITFSPIADAFLKQSMNSQNDIVIRMQREFRGHPLYVQLDYNSLPIPLRDGLYIVITKNEGKVLIESIQKLHMDPIVMTKWNDASSLYFNILSKLKYRSNHLALINESVFNNTILSFKELFELIDDLTSYDNAHVSLRGAQKIHKYKLHAAEQFEAAKSEYELMAEANDIERILGIVAVKLETALSSIHKLLVEYGE